MDITLKSLYNECIYGIDTSEDEWAQTLMKNIGHLDKELRMSPGIVPLLNILLQDKYKKSLSYAISSMIEQGFDVEGGDMVNPKATLKMLGLFSTMQWPVVYKKQIMYALIKLLERKISSLCSDNDYNQSTKSDLDEWISERFFPFVAEVFSHSTKHLPTIQKELRFAATDYIVRVRSRELFEVVAEYPDSLVALKELRDNIKHTDNIAFVGKSFRTMLRKRLLHLGASTSQILDFYVSMIKALRVLDASDFLLNFVAAPVRGYLLSRKDAVRCIVASLTEGKQSELHGELKSGGNLAYAADEDDEEAGPGVNWEPRKRNKELFDASTSASGLDTLALLVSIYGSTDLFIVEYRSLLADKLLSNTTYATDSEVANLELLKIRFGEESLHSCEVMLKDVEDSKRANNGVHGELARAKKAADGPAPKLVDYTMLSEHYWPSIPKDAMVYHPRIQSQLSTYLDTYAVLKKPRKLHPAMSLGQVEVELVFGDVTREFTVTPAQASVIMFFQDPGEHNLAPNPEKLEEPPVILSLAKLASLSEMEPEELFSTAVLYWVAKGVLKEVPDPTDGQSSSGSATAPLGYADPFADPYADEAAPDRFLLLLEDQAGSEENGMDVSTDNGDAQDNQSRLNSAANAQQKAALVLIEGYVRGLLSGHGTMSLERLHSMLRMIAGNSSTGGSSAGDVHFDMTLQQLRAYLQGLVDGGKVEYLEGVYALCQPAARS